MFNILRPFIFKFNPETAHTLAIKALKFGYIPPFRLQKSKLLETEVYQKEILQE